MRGDLPLVLRIGTVEVSNRPEKASSALTFALFASILTSQKVIPPQSHLHNIVSVFGRMLKCFADHP